VHSRLGFRDYAAEGALSLPEWQESIEKAMAILREQGDEVEVLRRNELLSGSQSCIVRETKPHGSRSLISAILRIRGTSL